MKHQESTFRGAGNIELFRQNWQPDTTQPRAAFAVVHGFGEHSGRYANVVSHLVPLGYAVWAFDLRGHGRSPGPRGHITSWDEYRMDVAAFLASLKQTPDLPTFLYGHSLGGLIVLDFALHHPDGLTGVIASAPALGKLGISPVLLVVGRVLSRIYPSYSRTATGDPRILSRDPEAVAAYERDELVHGVGSARLSTEIASTISWVQGHAPEFHLPLLILHGTADQLTSPRASREFFERVPILDKELREYTGGHHEPHNDIIYREVLRDVEDWLERHLAPGTT